MGIFYILDGAVTVGVDITPKMAAGGGQAHRLPRAPTADRSTSAARTVMGIIVRIELADKCY